MNKYPWNNISDLIWRIENSMVIYCNIIYPKIWSISRGESKQKSKFNSKINLAAFAEEFFQCEV